MKRMIMLLMIAITAGNIESGAQTQKTKKKAYQKTDKTMPANKPGKPETTPSNTTTLKGTVPSGAKVLRVMPPEDAPELIIDSTSIKEPMNRISPAELVPDNAAPGFDNVNEPDKRLPNTDKLTEPR